MSPTRPSAKCGSRWGTPHRAGISLAGVRVDSIVITPEHGIGYLDFANAEAMASPESWAADAASLLIATAEVVGPDRAIGVAIEACGPERVAELLPLIQPQVLPTDPGLRTRKRKKQDLKGLRLTAAEQLGIPPVEPLPLARVQLSKLLMLAGTFFGIWLLVEQLVGLQGIGHLIASANWWWFLAVLLITQATAVTEAISLSGAMPGSPPLGPLSLLRLAMNFTGMIGGTVGTTATVVRFNQRRGSAPAVAISSGLIYSVTGFIIQILLTLIALVFAADDFHRVNAGRVRLGARRTSNRSSTALWLCRSSSAWPSSLRRSAEPWSSGSDPRCAPRGRTCARSRNLPAGWCGSSGERQSPS